MIKRRTASLDAEKTRRPARWALAGRTWVILMAGAVLVMGVFLSHFAGPKAPTARLLPASLADAAAYPNAQSSSWYCTGGMGNENGTAISTVLLDNTTDKPVHGVEHIVSQTGTYKTEPVTVPRNSQLLTRPGRVVTPEWIATTVTMHGGGVTASLQVQGPSGWAITPCASLTSTSWYFASGATQTGDNLFLSLYNPTATLAVCDVTFYSNIGKQQPGPFEGLVLQPGAVVTKNVGLYVQNATQISTAVTAVNGTVVASELQIDKLTGLQGVSIHTGTPALVNHWSLASTTETPTGSNTLVIANPSTSASTVMVNIEAPSGPLLPFSHTIAAGGVWQLNFAKQHRIPSSIPLALTIAVTNGPGVVVDRLVQQSTTTPIPEWANGTPEVGAQANASAHLVVVPRLTLTIPGPTETFSISAYNPTNHFVRVVISKLSGARKPRVLITKVVRAHHSVTFLKPFMNMKDAVLIHSSGDISVMGQESFGAGQTPGDIPSVPIP
jgi:hypothetical protein